MNRLLAVLFVCCSVCSSSCLADESAGGFVLLRIKEINNESNARIDLTNVDTSEIVKVRSKTCNSGGIESKVCLVPAPAGRYFWSRFEIEYKLRGSVSFVEGPGIRRQQPGSATDSVEVLSGAINYIGDWVLKNAKQWNQHSHRHDYSVEINQDPKTLQDAYEYFPEATSQYEIYLSMLGKEAISLQDFLKLVEQNSR